MDATIFYLLIGLLALVGLAAAAGVVRKVAPRWRIWRKADGLGRDLVWKMLVASFWLVPLAVVWLVLPFWLFEIFLAIAALWFCLRLWFVALSAFQRSEDSN